VSNCYIALQLPVSKVPSSQVFPRLSITDPRQFMTFERTNQLKLRKRFDVVPMENTHIGHQSASSHKRCEGRPQSVLAWGTAASSLSGGSSHEQATGNHAHQQQHRRKPRLCGGVIHR